MIFGFHPFLVARAQTGESLRRGNARPSLRERCPNFFAQRFVEHRFFAVERPQWGAHDLAGRAMFARCDASVDPRLQGAEPYRVGLAGAHRYYFLAGVERLRRRGRL